MEKYHKDSELTIPELTIKAYMFNQIHKKFLHMNENQVENIQFVLASTY